MLLKEADSKSFSVRPKAISPQCQYGLTIVKDCVYLLDLSSGKETKTQILINTFDSSDYRDVLLGEAGNQILYRTSDNAEIKNITSGETISFKNLSYVDHCNGIRPTFQMAASLQPRIVNPITGQILDCKLMKDYLFISPNGQYYAGTTKDLYDEYYYLETGEIVSKTDYDSLALKLTYPTDKGKESEEWKEVTKRRISFVKEHFEFINKEYPDLTHNSNDENQWDGHLLHDFGGKHFINRVIGVRGIALIRRMSDESVVAKIDLGSPLWYINYVSFSFDNRYVAIAGRYPNESSLGGLFLVYDLDKHEVLLFQTNSWAVWLTTFNKYNQVAAYSGEPIVYDAMIPPLVEEELVVNNHNGRNFLTFSPDGEYAALSNQGYISKYDRYGNERIGWGHQPSCEVFIVKSSQMDSTLKTYSDLSDRGISGLSDRRHNFPKTIASVSFSNDNKRLMMVGNDGVVIIRNLHLA